MCKVFCSEISDIFPWNYEQQHVWSQTGTVPPILGRINEELGGWGTPIKLNTFGRLTFKIICPLGLYIRNPTFFFLKFLSSCKMSGVRILKGLENCRCLANFLFYFYVFL